MFGRLQIGDPLDNVPNTRSVSPLLILAVVVRPKGKVVLRDSVLLTDVSLLKEKEKGEQSENKIKQKIHIRPTRKRLARPSCTTQIRQVVQ